MRKYSIDFLYLIFNFLLIAYCYFMIVIKSFHIIDDSTPLYVGIGIISGFAVNNIRLKLKKENVNILILVVLINILIVSLYLYLFNYYHYDFLHEKDAWQFGLIFIAILLFEAKYYFFSTEEIEEHEMNFFNTSKNKNSSDKSDKTDE